MTESTPPEPPADLAEPEHSQELMSDLAQLRAEHPNRMLDVVTFGGRDMIVFKPTDGQAAAMAQLGRSSRMEDLDRIANIVDLIQALLVEPEDRAWLAAGMLGGDIEFGSEETFTSAEPGVTALGLLDAITRRFGSGTNRAARRARRFR